ncbi:MAG: hypothetical protein Ct9H300mP1_15940 [Planctomycetaceae bacterium]|nr:MAG: hypothetical protein Ct9H300mP1_15940 [Planctomycetaceae bacterium]
MLRFNAAMAGHLAGALIANNVDLLAIYNTLLATNGVEYTELPMLITPRAGFPNFPLDSLSAFLGSGPQWEDGHVAVLVPM